MKRWIGGLGTALVCAFVLAMSAAYANPLCVTTDSGDSLWWVLMCFLG